MSAQLNVDVDGLQNVRLDKGVAIYKGTQKGLRSDNVTFASEKDDERDVAFKVTIARHDMLKYAGKDDPGNTEKALLHGKLDFSNVTVRELITLAAKFLAFRWIQIDARNCKHLSEANNRTWKVRDYLDSERKTAVRVNPVDAILSGKATLTAEQRAALLAMLQAA